jgi:hypothetical protein
MTERSFRVRCELAVVTTLRLLEWRVRRVTVCLVRLTQERAETDQARRLAAYEPWLSRLWEWRLTWLTTRIARLTRERAAADHARRLGNEFLFHEGLGRRR